MQKLFLDLNVFFKDKYYQPFVNKAAIPFIFLDHSVYKFNANICSVFFDFSSSSYFFVLDFNLKSRLSYSFDVLRYKKPRILIDSYLFFFKDLKFLLYNSFNLKTLNLLFSFNFFYYGYFPLSYFNSVFFFSLGFFSKFSSLFFFLNRSKHIYIKRYDFFFNDLDFHISTFLSGGFFIPSKFGFVSFFRYLVPDFFLMTGKETVFSSFLINSFDFKNSFFTLVSFFKKEKFIKFFKKFKFSFFSSFFNFYNYNNFFYKLFLEVIFKGIFDFFSRRIFLFFFFKMSLNFLNLTILNFLNFRIFLFFFFEFYCLFFYFFKSLNIFNFFYFFKSLNIFNFFNNYKYFINSFIKKKGLFSNKKFINIVAIGTKFSKFFPKFIYKIFFPFNFRFLKGKYFRKKFWFFSRKNFLIFIKFFFMNFFFLFKSFFFFFDFKSFFFFRLRFFKIFFNSFHKFKYFL